MSERADPDPGWYPDPVNSDTARYWDGYGWTDRTRPIQTGTLATSSTKSISDERTQELALDEGKSGPKRSSHRRYRGIAIGTVGFLLLLAFAGFVAASRDGTKHSTEHERNQAGQSTNGKSVKAENRVAVTITSPVEGSVLPAGSPVRVTGSISPGLSEVREVVLLTNEIEVARWTRLDEGYSWSPPAGTHALRLRVMLSRGEVVQSPPVAVTALMAQGPPGSEHLGRWIVVLASLSPAEYSDTQVQQRLNALRSMDPRASLLSSDDFPSLRPGFRVIYIAPFNGKEEALGYCDQRRLAIPQQCYDRKLSMDPADRDLPVGR